MDNNGGTAAVPASMASSAGSRSAGDGVSDQFPAGLRVLVVDDDLICLKILEKMLQNCHYEVTTCSRAVVALSMLRERKGAFDLVLSDVYMPDMDGFKLLEHIGLEMDLPVIMMSADDGKDVVMKGVTHGACDYLIKPVRMEALKNIWQHVVRKKRNEWKELEQSGSVDDNDKQRKSSDDADYASSVNEANWKQSRKRKDGKDEEDESDEREDSSTLKKPRVVWSVELHQQFVAAVNQLGIDKAVPKKILELMNVPGLTRENVASHLQKYRLYLKRVSGVSQHQGGISTPFIGAPESAFGSIASLDGFSLQALAASGQLPQHNLMTLQAGLGRTTSNAGMGISLADQINLLNSDTHFANSSKVKYGGQQLGNKQASLLQGLPNSVEPKQLAHMHHSMQPFGNMGPQVGEGTSGFLNSPTSLQRTASSSHVDTIHGHQTSSFMMPMTQQRPQFPVYQNQSQTQVDFLQQSRPKGQLLNEIASNHSSGLPSSVGKQILFNEIVGQVVGRNGNFTNVSASQASSVDYPELSKNGFPLTRTDGLSNLTSAGIYHEALPAIGSYDGQNNATVKGSRGIIQSYGPFNELQHSSIPYESSHLVNSYIKNDPDFSSLVLGHQGFSATQINVQNRNSFLVGKGEVQMKAEEGSRNLQSISQHHGNPFVDHSFGVKVENVSSVSGEQTQLTEQFGQEDLMSTLLRQQQEGVGLAELDGNFDGYPTDNIPV